MLAIKLKEEMEYRRTWEKRNKDTVNYQQIKITILLSALNAGDFKCTMPPNFVIPDSLSTLYRVFGQEKLNTLFI